MNKKIDYNLVNFALIGAIVFVLFVTKSWWFGVASKMISIITPFLLAFALAYAVYPFLKFMENKGIPKFVAVIIIVAVIVAFISGIIAIVIPLIIDQAMALFSSLLKWLQDSSIETGMDFSYFQGIISNLNNILGSFGQNLTDLGVNFINQSINVLTTVGIAFIVGVYILVDMDNIRNGVKKFLAHKGKKQYNYVKALDNEISQYFVGLGKFILIQWLEYTVIFWLIGHPYWILMGVLASFTTIIPYFGGIIANIIALITAVFVNTRVFILTLIVALILPNVDGYIIQPRIFPCRL